MKLNPTRYNPKYTHTTSGEARYAGLQPDPEGLVVMHSDVKELLEAYKELQRAHEENLQLSGLRGAKIAELQERIDCLEASLGA